MKSISKNIKYFLIILIVAALAIAAGKLLSSRIDLNTNQFKQTTSESNSLTDQIDKADYVAAPPTYGPIIITQEIDVEFTGNMAIGYIVNQDLGETSLNDDVILFDKENFVLPLGGIITKIEDSTNNRKKITIELPEGTQTEFLSNTLSIINLEVKGSKRVPLMALQKDENDQNFVWIGYSSNNSEKLDKVRRLYIDVALSDVDYFVERGQRIDTFDPIIINPDEKIRSDKKYNIFYTEFVGSLHNPIRQALLDYEEYRVKLQSEEYQEALARCGQVKSDYESGKYDNEAASGSSSCGGFSNQTDPLAIFNSLINTPVGSGSCGSAACGQ